MGKPKLPSAVHVSSCNVTTCTSKYKHSKLLDIRKVCADHFSGQVVTMAEFPVAPYIISPKVYGVKQISGCSINLLFYYAKHYKFRPKFYITGAGPFNPRNQSFGPGKFDDVGFIFCYGCN